MVHHRKKLRLEGYDYASDGVYFITILIQNRVHLLGDIADNKLCLSPAGEMLSQYWYELPQKHPHFELDDFVVMPNHFHSILIINNAPNNEKSVTLSQGIQWFKTVTTNAYIRGVKDSNWTPFVGKLWHRSFHDHIIRDERALHTLKMYIAQNPEKWIEDVLFS
ncbi:MAG: transposase [Phototrophicales bacterium]|nr:transposase [Phototrophicales bacterium]